MSIQLLLTFNNSRYVKKFHNHDIVFLLKQVANEIGHNWRFNRTLSDLSNRKYVLTSNDNVRLVITVYTDMTALVEIGYYSLEYKCFQSNEKIRLSLKKSAKLIVSDIKSRLVTKYYFPLKFEIIYDRERVENKRLKQEHDFYIRTYSLYNLNRNTILRKKYPVSFDLIKMKAVEHKEAIKILGTHIEHCVANVYQHSDRTNCFNLNLYDLTPEQLNKVVLALDL